MRKAFQLLIILLPALLPATSIARDKVPLVNTDRVSKLVSVNVHAGVGNSFVSQNYESVFPEISDLSLGSGWAFMGGATCEFGIRDYLALGCEANLLIDNYSADIIVHRQSSPGVSNVFLNNHYYYLNFPVYASFKLNIANTVRWNIDAGIYYSYGVGGHQRQTVYNAVVNDLGQLISSSYTIKNDYFNDSRSFINSAHRSDVGLHLATGLTFSHRIAVGVRTQIGYKNIANTIGINKPNLHNFSFLGTLGYFF